MESIIKKSQYTNTYTFEIDKDNCFFLSKGVLENSKYFKVLLADENNLLIKMLRKRGPVLCEDITMLFKEIAPNMCAVTITSEDDDDDTEYLLPLRFMVKPHFDDYFDNNRGHKKNVEKVFEIINREIISV